MIVIYACSSLPAALGNKTNMSENKMFKRRKYKLNCRKEIFVIALEALLGERETQKLFNNPSQISLNHDYFCQKRKKQTEKSSFFAFLLRLLEHIWELWTTTTIMMIISKISFSQKSDYSNSKQKEERENNSLSEFQTEVVNNWKRYTWIKPDISNIFKCKITFMDELIAKFCLPECAHSVYMDMFMACWLKSFPAHYQRGRVHL